MCLAATIPRSKALKSFDLPIQYSLRFDDNYAGKSNVDIEFCIGCESVEKSDVIDVNGARVVIGLQMLFKDCEGVMLWQYNA